MTRSLDLPEPHVEVTIHVVEVSYGMGEMYGKPTQFRHESTQTMRPQGALRQLILEQMKLQNETVEVVQR